MAVNGIVGGRGRRFARIDGTVYELGATIKPPGTARDADLDDAKVDGFKLVEIHDSYVVLERNAVLYRLDVKQPGLAHGDSIVRVKGRD